tara:strand:- start:3524 stop:3760 length:237 start_codon:yes stop_codon:yes gene_type:complete
MAKVPKVHLTRRGGKRVGLPTVEALERAVRKSLKEGRKSILLHDGGSVTMEGLARATQKGKTLSDAAVFRTSPETKVY